MSDLTRFRDHARAMSTATHRPECHATTTTLRGATITNRPDPLCRGCIPDSERELWATLATEVDTYLGEHVVRDLFGELTVEPTSTRDWAPTE